MLQRAVGALHLQVDVLLHHLVQHEIVRDAGDDPDDAHGLGRRVEADPRVAHDEDVYKRQSSAKAFADMAMMGTSAASARGSSRMQRVAS